MTAAVTGARTALVGCGLVAGALVGACSIESKPYHRERFNGYECIVSQRSADAAVEVDCPGMPSSVPAPAGAR